MAETFHDYYNLLSVLDQEHSQPEEAEVCESLADQLVECQHQLLAVRADETAARADLDRLTQLVTSKSELLAADASAPLSRLITADTAITRLLNETNEALRTVCSKYRILQVLDSRLHHNMDDQVRHVLAKHASLITNNVSGL